MKPLAVMAEDVLLARPLPLRHPLVLEDARRPGEMVDVVECLKGHVVFVRGICPECPHWNPSLGDADGLRAYKRLHQKYGNHVAFVGVRNDFGHYDDRSGRVSSFAMPRKSYQRRLADAGAYASEFDLPGMYLVNSDGLDFHVACEMLATQEPQRPAAHAGGFWGIGIILDRTGRIVFRHGHWYSLEPFEPTIRAVFESLRQ